MSTSRLLNPAIKDVICSRYVAHTSGLCRGYWEGGSLLGPRITKYPNQFSLSRAMASAADIPDMDERKYSVTLDTMNPFIKKMEYAVRGPLLLRAAALENELKEGAEKPFTEILRANIGDCHAMGQVPITFIREVLALVSFPPLLDDPRFPDDVKDRARAILSGCGGGSVGSYTDSPGIKLIRQHCAQYIEKRDGGINSNWEDVVLSAGASDGIKGILKLLICNVNGKPSGVMVPIPQYPLYSATLTEFNLQQIGYYLDEENSWGLDVEELNRSITESKKHCTPRAIVVINPGNPTGQLLSECNIEGVIKFAHKENLVILADEVYQDNVYQKGGMFHSFKKVLMEMDSPYNRVELASFMSCSKGYMGECGLRGGYAELVNFHPDVRAMHLKSISVMLCPTTLGQTVIDCVVNPPVQGEPSFEKFDCEKKDVLKQLRIRAKMVEDKFNSIEGVSCNAVQGAMYAFPQVKLPAKALEAAKAKGQAGCAFYAFALLEKTGICIVPGSGFGQRKGTYHFRTTILPQTDKLEEMLDKYEKFHTEFMEQYK